jgi:hypothetical protein
VYGGNPAQSALPPAAETPPPAEGTEVPPPAGTEATGSEATG